MLVSANPPTLSAEECHSLLVKAHRLGNRARHRFIRILLHVQQSRLHLLLGYSSIYQYSEAKFRYSPTQTAEFLRVAKALLGLPRSAAAFDGGTISWSALELYSRVAVEATEGEWIRFVKQRSLGQLRAEVEDAIQKGRDRPRKDTHSLPRLMVRVVHLFTPEEHAVYQKAVAKDQGELSRSLGGKDVEPKEAVLYRSRRTLETDPAGEAPDRVEREDPLNTVLYRRCTRCRDGGLLTPEGPVEVPGEVLDRVEREATIVEIRPEEEMQISLEETSAERDRPNPPWLVRKVRLRDGGMCANTFCRRRLGLHAHHIVFRARGGRTVLPNLVMVCQYCHSLLHSGLLEIRGDPITGLAWRTRCDSLEPTLEEDRAEVAAIPLVVPAPPAAPKAETPAVLPPPPEELPPAAQGSGHPDPSKQSQTKAGPVVTVNGAASSAESPEGRAFLALKRLGYSAPEARGRIARAREKLAGRSPPPDDGQILRAALTG